VPYFIFSYEKRIVKQRGGIKYLGFPVLKSLSPFRGQLFSRNVVDEDTEVKEK